MTNNLLDPLAVPEVYAPRPKKRRQREMGDVQAYVIIITVGSVFGVLIAIIVLPLLALLGI